MGLEFNTYSNQQFLILFDGGSSSDISVRCQFNINTKPVIIRGLSPFALFFANTPYFDIDELYHNVAFDKLSVHYLLFWGDIVSSIKVFTSHHTVRLF